MCVFGRDIVCVIVLIFSPALFAGEFPQIRYQSKDSFIKGVFEEEPKWKMIRLTSALKKSSKAILGHRYKGGRIRYWTGDGKTAWIIDEIGKEMPITIGVSVENGVVNSLSILVYREERGGEVYQSWFTNQFLGKRYQSDQRLVDRIDGITGATLSVAAVSKVVELVLMLDSHVGAIDEK